MRHEPINPQMFISNRERLAKRLLPKSLAVVNANDIPTTNSDGSTMLVPSSDLFYLTGIEQEQSILVLAPEAFDERLREVLFLREPNETTMIWEGHKHSKEEATAISGIKTIRWLAEFPRTFRELMHELENVYLNSNEHNRAVIEVASRDTRFAQATMAEFPLHQYKRLAPHMHDLRVVKSEFEIALMKKALEITEAGYRRVLKFLKPGVTETEIEAEFVHEFTRRSAKFSYNPIIATGKNACTLHYNDNNKRCEDGQLVLIDVGAAYANYNADLTRTFPVNGRFTPRQRDVYNAVLRVMRASSKGAVPGKFSRDWQNESKVMMNEELIKLGLLKKEDADKHTMHEPACKKYFMHGLGHPLGLDTHDVGRLNQPFAPGWLLTVEPAIYIPEEGFAVRIENNVLITESGPVDLSASVPVEADEIEALMRK